jgi:hypothetical protein
MQNKLSLVRTILLVLSCSFSLSVSAQTSAFTYQGRLDGNGAAANGSYDFQFTVYNAASSGSIVGGPVTNAATGVSNGVFTAQLDFGTNVFTGAGRWLQIGVRTNGDVGAFSILAPLQPVTSSPYAIRSGNAATATTALTATTATTASSVAGTNITGTIATAQLPASVVLNNGTGLTLNGAFSGDGSALTNLSLGGLNGITTSIIPLETNKYTNFGTYSITVPANVTRMRVKLWGAAGGGRDDDVGLNAAGGAGAYVGITLNVVAGETYVAVVGRGGGTCPVCAGGVGSNNAQGGTGQLNYPASVTGGQASSFFKLANSRYFMKAVAGAGGGSGGASAGAGGNPGGSVGSIHGGFNGVGGTGNAGGTDYSSNALSLGETNLNLMAGNGGNTALAPGFTSAGGGGGGYGGGGGGFTGAGGGSYGDTIIGGNLSVPGNTNDSNYIAPAGAGVFAGNGRDGLIVVIFDTPVTTLTGNLATANITSSSLTTSNITCSSLFTVSGGIFLNNATSNVIQFANVGVAPPSANSAGWRLKTWGSTYGLGIDAGNQWYSAATLHTWWFDTGNQGTSFVKTMQLSTGGDLLVKGTSAGLSTEDRAGTTGPWTIYANGGRLRFYNASTGADEMSLESNGTLRAAGSVFAPTSPDIAETIAAADNVEAGDIVCADPSKRESVIRCGKENRGVLGVISDGTGGFLINAHGQSANAPLTGKPLVLAGRVPVKVCLENGPVRIGDTLAPSSIPGVAMRSNGVGPTIGIALDNFDGSSVQAEETGMVLCFVKVTEGTSSAIQELQEQKSKVESLEKRISDLEAIIHSLAK